MVSGGGGPSRRHLHGGVCKACGQQEHASSSARSACRSEDQIRAYIKSGGTQLPEAAENGAAAAAATEAPSAAELAARFPPAAAETFSRWFPGLPLSKTACDKPRCGRWW